MFDLLPLLSGIKTRARLSWRWHRRAATRTPARWTSFRPTGN